MKETTNHICSVAIMCLVALLLGYSGFKFERWINWKLDYGKRVEKRLESIEKRVKELEDNERLSIMRRDNWH